MLFLENFNIFEQIGIVLSIMLAALFFCVVLQFYQVIKIIYYPVRMCCRSMCRCECQDSEGEPINWDEYSIRCPCL